MKLGLFAFGKLKTPGLRPAADYYLKIIRPWFAVEEVELKPTPATDLSPASQNHYRLKESELLRKRLEKFLSPRGRFFLLDETGQARTSPQWADLIRGWENDGIPEIALCVGSSLGFDEGLRRDAHGLLSLGPQTLPHELARVVLAEQMYRAASLLKGHPYHHA